MGCPKVFERGIWERMGCKLLENLALMDSLPICLHACSSFYTCRVISCFVHKLQLGKGSYRHLSTLDRIDTRTDQLSTCFNWPIKNTFCELNKCLKKLARYIKLKLLHPLGPAYDICNKQDDSLPPIPRSSERLSFCGKRLVESVRQYLSTLYDIVFITAHIFTGVPRRGKCRVKTTNRRVEWASLELYNALDTGNRFFRRSRPLVPCLFLTTEVQASTKVDEENFSWASRERISNLGLVCGPINDYDFPSCPQFNLLLHAWRDVLRWMHVNDMSAM
jgi:hypothetical protein